MNAIRALRKKMGITQKKLSEKIGCTDVTISFWENNKHKPNICYMKKIIKIAEKNGLRLSVHSF